MWLTTSLRSTSSQSLCITSGESRAFMAALVAWRRGRRGGWGSGGEEGGVVRMRVGSECRVRE